MLRPRIIPCLLIKNGGLVKTKCFKEAKYVGDPINAVRIFNEKEADELMIIDIDATAKGEPPNFSAIEKIAAECSMPLCYGGGVTTAEQASKIISLGVEKIAISSAAVANPKILTEISDAVGKQSVVAVLDVRKKNGFLKSGYEITTHNNSRNYRIDPFDLAVQLQSAGAGEIVINSVHNDGIMEGYDLDLAFAFKGLLKIPLTFLGGAGSMEHIGELISRVGVVGASAGSLFVFKGRYRAVLINYPSHDTKLDIFKNSLNF